MSGSRIKPSHRVIVKTLVSLDQLTKDQVKTIARVRGLSVSKVVSQLIYAEFYSDIAYFGDEKPEPELASV